MIMKIVTTDNRVLMAILVIASIGGTLAVVQGFDLVNYNSQNPLSTGGAMLTGNVKVIQYDENGNIKAYRQTDNHIVKEGMEVIMAQVFGGINSTSSCPTCPQYSTTLGLPHPIRFMQIGTGGEWRLLHNDTNIGNVIPACLRQLATITNSSAAHGYHTLPGVCDDGANVCRAQMNVTAVANFLGSAGCNVLSIDEAGIYDNSTTAGLGQRDGGGPSTNDGYMFARNNFGSVNLGALDTLQLQWEFTFTDS